jgi:hypothetical protein
MKFPFGYQQIANAIIAFLNRFGSRITAKTETVFLNGITPGMK